MLSWAEAGSAVSKNVFTFTEHDGGTRATYVSTYDSAEALQQVLDMGVGRRRHVLDQPDRRPGRLLSGQSALGDLLGPFNRNKLAMPCRTWRPHRVC